MQRVTIRQAILLGLAFLLVMAVGRAGWRAREAVRAQAGLLMAGKWLRGLVIVVDPGHGGPDPGAVVKGTLEKDVALEIARVTKQTMEQSGATVVLTRDRDMNLGGRLREELGRRVALVDEHDAQVYISIHANKDNCDCRGAQTFYQNKGMPAGQALALSIQARMRSLTPTRRVALPADYFVLRSSPVPAAMVEVGFLTNAAEHAQLKDPAYQRKLAVAIALGVADWVRSTVPPAQAGASIGR